MRWIGVKTKERQIGGKCRTHTLKALAAKGGERFKSLHAHARTLSNDRVGWETDYQ